MKEAQRFPADYDGIIAGAPANYWTHLNTKILLEAQAARRNNESLLSQDKLALLHKAVLAACDNNDKVSDGVLENPAACKFDPKTLICKDGSATACLTSVEAEAATSIYSAAVVPGTGVTVFPGLARGSEADWSQFLIGPAPNPINISSSTYRYLVYNDPQWDYQSLDLARDLPAVDRYAEIMNSTDPNLKAFFDHGGKLLQFHGWSDAQISPQNSIDYYKSVVSTLGSVRKVDTSYRLFMIPGMGHCGGGEGPNLFDTISPLEQWVERGKVPTSIPVSRIEEGKTTRTRPLCPFPQEAVYKGTGSPDEAADFSCRLRK